jgi:GTP cyclohydrolase IA
MTKRFNTAAPEFGGMGQATSWRRKEIEEHYAAVLELLGYDLTDEHVKKTPQRAALALWDFRSNGHDGDVERLLGLDFESQHDSLVQVGPIRVVSMCAHHMLPVTGWGWVGYIPDSKVCGLSKLARVLEHYARQLTIQERLTQQVVEALEQYLSPRGSMCVIRAWHGCMSLRGVEEPSAATVTSAVRGVFLTDQSAKAEFMQLMTQPGGHQ